MSKMRMKVPDGLQSAYKLARELQWTVERVRNGHLAWHPPDGGPAVQTAYSPRTYGHHIKNDLARLRKAGLPC